MAGVGCGGRGGGVSDLNGGHGVRIGGGGVWCGVRTLSARLTFPETQSSQRRRAEGGGGAGVKVASWRRVAELLLGPRSQRHTGVKSQPHCAHTAGTDERGILPRNARLLLLVAGTRPWFTPN